jgi:hypothetical protein
MAQVCFTLKVSWTTGVRLPSIKGAPRRCVRSVLFGSSLFYFQNLVEERTDRVDACLCRIIIRAFDEYSSISFAQTDLCPFTGRSRQLMQPETRPSTRLASTWFVLAWGPFASWSTRPPSRLRQRRRRGQQYAGT